MNGLLIGIIALVVGVVIGFGIFRYIITSKYKQMMKKAERLFMIFFLLS